MNILLVLTQYRSLFLLLFEVIFIIVLIAFAKAMYEKWKKEKEQQERLENKKLLKADYKGTIDETERQNVIRKMLAMDGVDPSPKAYMCVSDGGGEYFVRSVTISQLPKTIRFADTLRELYDFPDCTINTFVKPIPKEEVERMMDKQINILGVEQIAEAGNTNRVRKLGHQIDETTRLASEVETSDKKYFKAGWLITFVAESVDELTKITDSFRALALNKKIDISNCYGVQSEAFLSSMPFNRTGAAVYGGINSDAVNMFLMDQASLSVILNYTTDYFSHKKGVPLGRNYFTGMPFLFDLYDKSHDGFTVCMAGKTRSGKTATIKMLMERTIPHGYRYVVIDSQTRKGTSEGEYSSVTELNAGINFQVSSKNRNILNPFHVQESTEYVKTSPTTGYEKRTLDLNGAITEMVYTVRTMLQIDAEDKKKPIDVVFDSDLNIIISRTIKELFAERGIMHGDPDSLYEEGEVFSGAVLGAGYVPKILPTLSDFFIKVMKQKWENKDEKLEDVYKLIINNIFENIRELYYVEDEHIFISREEYLESPVNPDKPGEKVYITTDDDYAPITVVKGIRPYFDGQSTLFVTKNTTVVNIDISQLTDNERKVAREIAVRFVNEQFIKKNSENLEDADKLVVIVDEAHENFEYVYGRKTFANATRTAAKRNTGIIFSTQTVAEFTRYNETRDIMRQAAVKMIFKQSGNDKELLMNELNITESQAYLITNRLGVAANDESDERGAHKGEMCVIDGAQVLFVKVDYLRSVEMLAVESDASQVFKKIRNQA